MRVFGIDFTSRPRRSKPLTCLNCEFNGYVLRAGALEKWPSFSGFEQMLRCPGPWIAGIDFPFGQSRKFIETIGWPTDWREYVCHARSLGREGFREALTMPLKALDPERPIREADIEGMIAEQAY
jgi:hypothetical protein